MPKRKTIYHQNDEDENSVYMFLNKKYGLELFINADGFDDAMKIFDICSFENREEWEIYLRCGNQPTGGRNARKTR